VEDMGRREGRLVEHMVEVAREVSSEGRWRTILVYGANISKIRRKKIEKEIGSE
jgi:hypothetical protein